MSVNSNASRRAFIAFTALASVAAAPRAAAQFGGGRSRDRGGSASSRRSHTDDATVHRLSAQRMDPAEAIERELPSLRVDLQLTPEQASYFDSYERQVRLAVTAGQMRARHVDAYRNDDGSSVKAASVLRTMADDDADRADADRLALERLDALYAVLTPEQQKQFDARTIQSLREPLGAP